MSEQTSGQGNPDTPDAVGERAPVERGDGDAVDLGDRTAPGNPGTGYSGSPVGNQGKAEPVPPTPGHADPAAPLTPPTLDEMNVGADDPQRPSHDMAASAAPTSSAAPGPGAGPGDAPRDLSGTGQAPAETRPETDATTTTGTDRGPEVPLSTSPGTSHKAPGLQGETSPAEQVETDVEDSAAAMERDTGRPSGSGDTQGVPSVGQTPSAGTSEQHGVVQGARIPRADGAEQG